MYWWIWLIAGVIAEGVFCLWVGRWMALTSGEIEARALQQAIWMARQAPDSSRKN